jgi:hypothetical protein
VGKVFDGIDESLAAWIAAQPMGFVATAPLAADDRVNVSPRGSRELLDLGPHRVGWVDYTGSGVETIAHLRENGRICVMFAAFDRRPRVVRLHGHAAASSCPVTRCSSRWPRATPNIRAPGRWSSWTLSGSGTRAATASR